MAVMAEWIGVGTDEAVVMGSNPATSIIFFFFSVLKKFLSFLAG